MLTMQAYIDGLPIFTLSVYGWSSGQCGILIGILGLVAPVINTAVGAFSARLPDRHITVGPQAVIAFPSPSWMECRDKLHSSSEGFWKLKEAIGHGDTLFYRGDGPGL